MDDSNIEFPQQLLKNL